MKGNILGIRKNIPTTKKIAPNVRFLEFTIISTPTTDKINGNEKIIYGRFNDIIPADRAKNKTPITISTEPSTTRDPTGLLSSIIRILSEKSTISELNLLLFGNIKQHKSVK